MKKFGIEFSGILPGILFEIFDFWNFFGPRNCGRLEIGLPGNGWLVGRFGNGNCGWHQD